MAMIWKPVTPFTLTPHKVSICILIQLYASSSSSSSYTAPFPFASIPQHNRFALFLISSIKAFDGFLEKQLDELMVQVKAVVGDLDEYIAQRLADRLSALTYPDDVFTFFGSLQGVFGNNEAALTEDEQSSLDTNCILGVFIRRCAIAFNILSFEGVCHLLSSIKKYHGHFSSSCSAWSHPARNLSISEEIESDASEKGLDEFEDGGFSVAHTSASADEQNVYWGLSEDSKPDQFEETNLNEGLVSVSDDENLADQRPNLSFLRSNWQVLGYLKELVDLIERNRGLYTSNQIESMLKLLHSLAPDLHRVHYVQHLNALYSKEYICALENLHCYYDYSAGLEGIDSSVCSSTAFVSDGKFGTALLRLGILHFHFGHQRLALEAFTEAVQISHKTNDDLSLAYTLAAICELLSHVTISNMNEVVNISWSASSRACLDASLATQQHLLVLLQQSMRRAENLKNVHLVAVNRLAMAKYDLKHVKRPFVSFGPNASTKNRTCPVHVCEKLRLSSDLLLEFGLDGLSTPIDGLFCTSWLRNLETPGCSVLDEADNGSIVDISYFGGLSNMFPSSLLQLCGASYLLRATSWELYGSAPLVRQNTLVHTICFPDAPSSDDAALAYVKLIKHLAVYKGYQEAFAALKLVEKKISALSNLRVRASRLQLLHECFLHRGQLRLAQQICYEYGLLVSSVSGVEIDLKTDASIRHARVLLAAKQFDQAASVAHSSFYMCYNSNMQLEMASTLILIAEIHLKSGNAIAGLPYVLASLTFCQTFNLDLLEATANLTLSEIWLSLGSVHAKRASNILHKVLPTILGHGGLELSARANIMIAKCYLSDSTFSVCSDPFLVLDPLEQACLDLEILEYHELAAEAFYLTAIVYNMLGKLEEREVAATSFRKHIMALENANDLGDAFLHD